MQVELSAEASMNGCVLLDAEIQINVKARLHEIKWQRASADKRDGRQEARRITLTAEARVRDPNPDRLVTTFPATGRTVAGRDSTGADRSVIAMVL